MAGFSFTGWTSSTASPKTLASRVVAAQTPEAATSAIGPVNAAAQSPVSAAKLMASPQALADQSLGSRSGSPNNPLVERREVPVQVSTFEGADTPDFLKSQISDLNANQTMRRSAQAELVNTLFKSAMGGNYLAWEALRAASVQPGSHVSFGSAVQSPAMAAGYARAADAYAARTQAQTKAMTGANDIQKQIDALTQKKQQQGMSMSPIGMGYSAEQQALDNRLQNLYQQQAAVRQMGVAAASGGSGWVPSMPNW